MIDEKLTLLDSAGTSLAEILVTNEENGWYFGEILVQRFPPSLKEALEWYDEVVENQMLSLLDKALASVEHFGLRVRFADGTTRPAISLQVSKDNGVSFRATPVPPPAWLSKSESA